MQIPLPDGVLHLACVQHLISESPGHNPDVTIPVPQQPPEMLTQVPVTPLAVQVAE